MTKLNSSGFRGETAEVIKETCGMECHIDRRPSISQVTDEMFVGVHLPAINTKLVCPKETLVLEESIVHGSVRFRAGCGCKILIGNRMVGNSTSKDCGDDALPPKLGIILPVQMTR